MGSGINAAALKQMQEKLFKKADSNGDGSSTKDELSQLTSTKNAQNGPSVDEMFAQLDTNNDSAISRLESDAGIAKLAQQMQSRKTDNNASSNLKEQVFKAADQNGDGTVSKDELTQLLSSSSKSSADIAKIFDALDTNKDGTISKSESDAAVDKAGEHKRAQGPPPPPPPPKADSGSSSGSSTVTTIFDAMDTNKDGTVSASELLAALASSDSDSAAGSSDSSGISANDAVTKIFDAMDTNKDGSVSKTELKEALNKIGQNTQGKETADNGAADTKKTRDSAVIAAAIQSYMQASINSLSQNSTASAFSSSAVYA
jgi:Ca2+-binding EF-hand superfamily protein